ncbi:hypothetical protein OS127_02945 [Corynebacterium sp. P6129]|uniref:hypothetical protein n=1 Tax=Corynebacterium antarcticum TaxID=2800405 RepID=UPI0022608BBA|nr:hypothetical protein [Corynebacterium antarcticum]MCX7491486.1 hypothetical protein [Corynebacterium antarcticum]
MSNDPAISVTTWPTTSHCPIQCDLCGKQTEGLYYKQEWVNERYGQSVKTKFCPDCQAVTYYIYGTNADPADARRALTQWAENVLSHSEAGEHTDPDETTTAEAYLARKETNA